MSHSIMTQLIILSIKTTLDMENIDDQNHSSGTYRSFDTCFGLARIRADGSQGGSDELLSSGERPLAMQFASVTSRALSRYAGAPRDDL